jgi:hypothetical protein
MQELRIRPFGQRDAWRSGNPAYSGAVVADFYSALPFVLNHEVVGWPKGPDGKPSADIHAGVAAVRAKAIKDGKPQYWFTQDPDDPGGATAFGITISLAQHYEIPTVDQLKAIDADMIMRVYRGEFWRFGVMSSQAVGSKLLDMCVNMGTNHAIHYVQVELNDEGASLMVDGQWGPKTVQCLDVMPPDLALDILCSAMKKRYLDIVGNRPESMKYLDGWLIRANDKP